jgi:hypothetical protein
MEVLVTLSNSIFKVRGMPGIKKKNTEKHAPAGKQKKVNLLSMGHRVSYNRRKNTVERTSDYIVLSPWKCPCDTTDAGLLKKSNCYYVKSKQGSLPIPRLPI